MAKRVEKSNLPSKPCAICARPFAWRKKWAKVWHEVKYCSDRCRSASPPGPKVEGPGVQKTGAKG